MAKKKEKKENKKKTKEKKEKKSLNKNKKEKKMVFEVEGDNDNLEEDISVELDDDSYSDEGEESESDEEGEKGKVNLDGEIKYLEVKASKPVSQIKKGDKVKVDNLNLEVDSQYVLIDHGKTKEIAIELFDSKTDKDYQLRYFSDQVNTSMEFYELDEIVYNKKDAEKVEW